MAGDRAQAAVGGVGQPGSMAPVISIRDIMALSGNDVKDELKRFDRVPNVGNMGMFTVHPDEPGAGMRVLEDVTTLVENCAAYRMGHLSMQQKFHLFISSAFSKEFRKLWQVAYREAPASTTGIEQGINIYMAFLNLFAALSTTSDKRQVLQMADDFLYNVRGFQPTWRDLVELFSLLDHTVMTTSSHRYSRHCLELWSDAKKIDFLIDMFSDAGHPWVLVAMTRPGAEQITTAAAAGAYLSTQMPEDGLVGDSDAVHDLTRGRTGPISCFGCQEPDHVTANCPHLAEGTSAPEATLTYNRPSAQPQRTDTSAQEMARAMDVNRRLEEASAAECRVEASTQRHLLLCDRVDLACVHAPGEAAAGRSADAVHSLLLPPVSPREHKVMAMTT